MTQSARAPAARWHDMAELLHQLGDVAPRRIRMDPLPGHATEKDLLRILDHENRLFELVDGVLVEKIMGLSESCVAVRLGSRLDLFAEDHDLGFVTGADGAMRLMRKLVRIPDVAFISWKQLPGKELPRDPIPHLAPDLAVEVLSRGNTAAEMGRKLKEYFLAGTQLVWIVDPSKRCVTVYRSPDEFSTMHEEDVLDGGDLLPGFRLPLKQLFARVARAGSRKASRRTRKA